MHNKKKNIRKKSLFHSGEDQNVNVEVYYYQEDSFQAILTSYYNEQSKDIQIFAYFLFLSFLIVHIVLIQQYLSSQAFAQIIQGVLLLFQNNSIITELIISVLALIKIFLLLPILAKVLKSKSYWAGWLVRKSIQKYILMSELDMVVSSFMVFISWKQAISLLFTTVFTQLFQAIYLQNYIIRKDALYASSAFSYISFRLLVVLTYFVNIVLFALGEELKFYIFHCFLGVLHIVWYLKSGRMLFIHRLVNNIFIIFNALLISVNYGLAERLIFEDNLVDWKQICKYLMLVPLTTTYLYIRSIPALQKMVILHLKSPKCIDLQMRTLLQSLINIKDIESELIGFLYLQHHQSHDGQQLQMDLYDPLLKTWIKSDSIYVQKQTAVIHFIKRNYQKSISIEQTPQLYIDFCQFLCNEFNNPYLAIKYLQRCTLYPLNTIQANKVKYLQYHIVSKWNKFNSELYNGKLQIQSFFQASNTIGNIGRDTINFIDKSINLWGQIKSRQLKPSKLRKIMKQQLGSLANLQKEWKEVFFFLSMNKRWLLMYNLYMFFIKNVESKKKIEDIADSLIEGPILNEIIGHNNGYVEEKKEKRYCNSSFMFSQDSCYLTANLQAGDLKITNINRILMNISGYELDEIIGGRIQVLMEEELAKIHQEKVDVWLESGRISNEKQYRIPFTCLVGKDARVIPALKYYKAYYHIEKGIQFVCLLKVNIKKNSTSPNNQLIEMPLKKHNFNKTHKSLQKLKAQSNKDLCSLEDQQNIFIKEDILQPHSNFFQISTLKWCLRLSIILVVLGLISFSGIVRSDSDNLNSYCNQFVTFMSMYRFPMVLATNYLKKYLSIGIITKANAQIQAATNGMLASSAGSLIKMTIFDPNLNPETLYYPYYNYSFLANDSKTNIDLFYTIVSSISSMNHPSINRTSPEFQRFYSYLKPAYDHMMNTTKNRLHSTFGQIFKTSVNKQISLMAIQSILPVLFLVLTLCILQSFTKKMTKILEIPLQFSPGYIETVEDYWKDKKMRFTALLDQSFKEDQISEQKSDLIDQQQTNKISKKGSLRLPSSFQNNQIIDTQIASKICMVVAVLAIILLSGGTQFIVWSKFQDLNKLQVDGFFFLRYFPCGPIVALGCVQRYYSLQHPQQITFDPRKYDDVLGATYMFGYTYDYINQIVNPYSLFYAKQKNYFFGSACEYNPAVLTPLNMTVQKCMTMNNGSFKQGVSGFLRYVYKFGVAYMNNEISLTAAQLDEFTVGTMVLSSYILDAMATWSLEFTAASEQVRSVSLTVCLLLIGATFVLHVIVGECKVIKSLEAQYELIKAIYGNLVPQFILIQDKVIRQKFVNLGMIAP